MDLLQTERELRDRQRRFIFQGGSPFAMDLSIQITRLRAENESLREVRRQDMAERLALRAENRALKAALEEIVVDFRNGQLIASRALDAAGWGWK